MPLAEKAQYADVVIDNSSTLIELESQVSDLLERLEEQVGWGWRLSWLFPLWGLIFGFWKVLARNAIRTRIKIEKDK